MDLNDILEEIFVEGMVEGAGTAFAIGFLFAVIGGTLFKEILMALMTMV